MALMAGGIVVIFGDPNNGTAVAGISAAKTLVICHTGDNICQHGDQVLQPHLTVLPPCPKLPIQVD
jgi:hypothetical protein